jgi:uncharacterized protein YjbI with pentapeptide repeats
MSESAPNFADQPLTRADLAPLAGQDVRLVNCTLDEADLKSLDLSSFIFERCSLAETAFTGATLEFAKFDHCRGAKVDFSATNCTEALFADCDFNNGTFHGATLTSTRFKSCKLTGVDFAQVHTFDIGFLDCLLVAARMPKMIFRKEKLAGIDFSMADLSDCDFREASFERTSLREANIERANFQNADLRGADLGGLNMLKDRQRFRGAVISAAQAELVLDEYGFRVRAK